MLDGGPARVSRSTDRRTVYRPESVRQQPPEEIHPESGYTEPVQRSTEPQRPTRKPKRKRSLKGLVIAGVIIVALAIAGWFIWTNTRGASVGTTIDSTKFQAVFLVGGQVYFGKLEEVNSQYLKLSNVFYIQSGSTDTSVDEQTSETSQSQGDMKLIKLGDAVHGPEDAMVINRDQMLFFENLRSDGKVVQLIQSHTSGQK